MIMRITNPYDLKHISESSESLDAKSMDVITGLNVGECLLVGSATNYPLFFKVRQRLSQPNKYEKNLQELVKDFVHKQKKNDDELDAYL
jgi:DNA helicase HerA-like ATPase